MTPTSRSGEAPHPAGLHAREPKAIHRALRVLEAVASLGAGVTAKQVSMSLDYPRATTYRLLNLLVQDGYLVRMPDLKGFTLGRKVTDLAGYVEPPRVSQAARGLLAEVRGQVRVGVHLYWSEHGRVLVADADPVFSLPEHAPNEPGVGHLAIATIAAPEGVPRPGSIDADGLAHAIDPIFGLPTVAAPIRDDRNRVVACLVLVAPTPDLAPGSREVRLLRDYAERLTPLIV